MKWRGGILVALLLASVTICLLGYVLHYQSDIFREFQAALLLVQGILLVCIAIWCGSFIFLTFNLNDLPLVVLLLVAIAAYFIGYLASWRIADALTLLVGVTLGRGAAVLLKADGRLQMANRKNNSEIVKYKSTIEIFLIGLVVLLAFSSWWHLVLASAYHGPRWMGLWDNPNIYGMLMGAGVALAIGLLKTSLKSNVQSPRLNKAKIVFLSVAIFMIGTGLIMSYSRGAWLGSAVGLLYLAWCYGKLKWKCVAIGVGLLALGLGLLWGRTADTDAWYCKRLDLSRPSAQHRVSAWRASLQMMRDHPLGVGWNKAVGLYDKEYSPPEGGAAALTMNSYLMMGTELGIPGLACFVASVALCFRKNRPHLTLALSPPQEHLIRPAATFSPSDAEKGTRIACRAGAVVLLVAFWFDGGLFELPTASVFWVLLELGSVSNAEGRMKTVEITPELKTNLS